MAGSRRLDVSRLARIARIGQGDLPGGAAETHVSRTSLARKPHLLTLLDHTGASLKRSVLQTARRVMRKVARMRKRVTRRCGMRCRKPCQRWGMKSMTRPPRPLFAHGLKRRNPLQQHHPKRQCGLRMCLVIYTFLCRCVQLCLYVSRRIFNCSLGGLR
jgi:hypothetical protein